METVSLNLNPAFVVMLQDSRARKAEGGIIIKELKQQLKLIEMKVREVIEKLEADGWYLARTRGSHRQFKHPIKPGTVTVPGKLSKDLAIGTLMSIWRQGQLEDE